MLDHVYFHLLCGETPHSNIVQLCQSCVLWPHVSRVKLFVIQFQSQASNNLERW